MIYFDDESNALGQRRCLRALVFFELVHRFIFWFGNTSERHYPLDRLRVVFCYFVAAYHPPKSPALPPIPVPVFGYLRFTEWLFLSLLVPPPRQLTLERQLNKSILIGWNHPEATPPESGQIACYHVYVDGILRTTVRATDRPRALIEGVDSNKVKFQSNFDGNSINFWNILEQPHRISVRSVTPRRRASLDAACTMVIGKEVPSAPTCVRVSHVTATSALISWLPANSNYQHAVCVNHVEVRTVKPGIFRHTISGNCPA